MRLRPIGPARNEGCEYQNAPQIAVRLYFIATQPAGLQRENAAGMGTILALSGKPESESRSPNP
jgi:hypothetical protein